MRLLLDTNVISDFVRGIDSVQSQLRACAPADLAMSSITVMELAYGLEGNPRRAIRIRPLIEALMSSINVVEYSQADAWETGRVRCELEAVGKPIGLCDSLLAGTARCRALTVVTHNTREFSRVDGLTLLDWRVDAEGGAAKP